MAAHYYFALSFAGLSCISDISGVHGPRISLQIFPGAKIIKHMRWGMAYATLVPKMFNIPPPNTQERQLIHIVALIF